MGQVATEGLLDGFVEGRRRIGQELVGLDNASIGLLEVQIASRADVSAGSNGSSSIAISKLVQLLSNLAISVAEWHALGYEL